jgi:hypothetical protein
MLCEVAIVPISWMKKTEAQAGEVMCWDKNACNRALEWFSQPMIF